MGQVNHFSDRSEHVNKDIRLLAGSRLLQRAPYIMDHFTGVGAFNSQVPQNWVTTETGAATPFAPNTASQIGGLAIAVTGATTNNGEELAGKNVGWKCSAMAANQRMILEVRHKAVGATTPADGDFVIGFADAVTYTNSLAYVVGASSLYTTSAPVEFAGFHYSSIPTSGTLFNASGNNFVGIITEKSSSAALALSSGVVKDSNFHIYRVELDSAANAAFFIDDALVGTVAACLTAATAVTPYFSGIAKNSHALTVSLDYAFVGGDLV